MRPDRRSILALIGAAVLPGRAPAAETGTLSVKVVSDETAAPMPCSVELLDSSGELVLENRSYLAGFRSGGEFRKALPPGPTKLTITRGGDFIAETRDVRIRT